MDQILLVIGGTPISALHAFVAAGALALVLLVALLWQNAGAARRRALEAAAAAERQRELDDKVAAMNQIQAEMTGRMQALAEIFGARQADLARLLSERLDSVRAATTQSLGEFQNRHAETLGRLNERLAVIDAAQADLKGLTSEVLSFKAVLADKQARGAYGQGRMEAIIRDALPAKAYRFQATLTNRARPDCVIDLPGDDRPLVIDAKFPLEGFAALRAATGDEARAAAEKRVRADLGAHIRDIADKYLLPGETQDIALLFVPSEGIYAELSERFEDVVQKAHRARVIIVSPSLLMMAVQVALSIVRDAAVREQARLIQSEIGRLVEDVRRLAERAGKLEQHFRQAQEDVAGITISADKVVRRGDRIEQLDFGGAEETAPIAAPQGVEAGAATALPFRRPAG
ncbi:MAG: DNA recombination protein RmuC [Hyphomicrobiales bacterium]|uniref:DNA recombination protein RmuC n=1 Tax=Rhabdaerophilum calidifontis TaxID=2604328 RepID=UPI00123B6732|nr:DNA recombination protein RmuC [Rhabdaerophilum calidifontis]MCA1953066.1 DNA recombination protein RmuC [Hyphomicrobiales bacterium]MCA1998386.1 DNA recombination protein RmuC [Hyphomicrobiales bacterium]